MAETTIDAEINQPSLDAELGRSAISLAAETIIANAPDPVFVSNLEGKILQANDAVFELLGFRPAELIEQSLSRIISPEETREFLAALREVVAGTVATVTAAIVTGATGAGARHRNAARSPRSGAAGSSLTEIVRNPPNPAERPLATTAIRLRASECRRATARCLAEALRAKADNRPKRTERAPQGRRRPTNPLPGSS